MMWGGVRWGEVGWAIGVGVGEDQSGDRAGMEGDGQMRIDGWQRVDEYKKVDEWWRLESG